jgi:hypothetical protein
MAKWLCTQGSWNPEVAILFGTTHRGSLPPGYRWQQP